MVLFCTVYVKKCNVRKSDCEYLIASPEIFKKCLEIGGDIVYGQFMNLTEKQRQVWLQIKSILERENAEVPLSDLSKFLGIHYDTLRKWIKHFENLEFLSTRVEGRDKYVQLMPELESKMAAPNFAKLEEAYAS